MGCSWWNLSITAEPFGGEELQINSWQLKKSIEKERKKKETEAAALCAYVERTRWRRQNKNKTNKTETWSYNYQATTTTTSMGKDAIHNQLVRVISWNIMDITHAFLRNPFSSKRLCSCTYRSVYYIPDEEPCVSVREQQDEQIWKYLFKIFLPIACQNFNINTHLILQYRRGNCMSCVFPPKTI